METEACEIRYSSRIFPFTSRYSTCAKTVSRISDNCHASKGFLYSRSQISEVSTIAFKWDEQVFLFFNYLEQSVIVCHNTSQIHRYHRLCFRSYHRIELIIIDLRHMSDIIPAPLYIYELHFGSTVNRCRCCCSVCVCRNDDLIPRPYSEDSKIQLLSGCR